MEKKIKPEKKLKVIRISKDTITSYSIGGATDPGPGLSALDGCPPTVSGPLT